MILFTHGLCVCAHLTQTRYAHKCARKRGYYEQHKNISTKFSRIYYAFR